MEKKEYQSSLYVPLSKHWDEEFLIEAYRSFCNSMEEEVDYEGFINGFAWALITFEEVFDSMMPKEKGSDFHA